MGPEVRAGRRRPLPPLPPRRLLWQPLPGSLAGLPAPWLGAQAGPRAPLQLERRCEPALEAVTAPGHRLRGPSPQMGSAGPWAAHGAPGASHLAPRPAALAAARAAAACQAAGPGAAAAGWRAAGAAERMGCYQLAPLATVGWQQGRGAGTEARLALRPPAATGGGARARRHQRLPPPDAGAAPQARRRPARGRGAPAGRRRRVAPSRVALWALMASHGALQGVAGPPGPPSAAATAAEAARCRCAPLATLYEHQHRQSRQLAPPGPWAAGWRGGWRSPRCWPPRMVGSGLGPVSTTG